MPEPPPVADIGRYEGAPESAEDYRRRQVVNLAAFLTVVMLVLAGIWIATTMVDLQRGQECVLAGRANCAQISITGAAPQ